jgi:hypothetical protein
MIFAFSIVIATVRSIAAMLRAPQNPRQANDADMISVNICLPHRFLAKLDSFLLNIQPLSG